jgi:hypothetical protein
MKPLLAIFSCHKYQYTDPNNQCMRDWYTRPIVDRVGALRDTWLKDVTIDYKVFRGRYADPRGVATIPPSDEIWLDAPDDYLHSAWKLQALVKWALEHGYDSLCKVDDDVFVYWDRFIKVGLEGDYSGLMNGHAANGFTYWLSKRSMEILAKSQVNNWCEDQWAGTTLDSNHIKGIRQEGYYLCPSTQTNQWITEETLSEKCDTVLSIHALSPQQMRDHYAEICQRRTDNKLA